MTKLEHFIHSKPFKIGKIFSTKWWQAVCWKSNISMVSDHFSSELWSTGSCHIPDCHCSLTHWGRVTHICVSKLTIIGSDNGLSPDQRQAIIWTNAGLLLIGPLGTNFSEILIEILPFSFKKMRLKVSSAKRRPFCFSLNVLIPYHNKASSQGSTSYQLQQSPVELIREQEVNKDFILWAGVFVGFFFNDTVFGEWTPEIRTHRLWDMAQLVAGQHTINSLVHVIALWAPIQYKDAILPV